ncbi:hypothetical protein T4C_6360 [Trichinella pseudospiralis]|uniref:Uncharacterized protein n=1 Tax=Trichinella pseudospiralis TaxID=6337 RepID=A0A0V1K9J4_TRIPS|nr:hypothetical protein T4C_6360 [Trichinella pseudospiralis]
MHHNRKIFLKEGNKPATNTGIYNLDCLIRLCSCKWMCLWYYSSVCRCHRSDGECNMDGEILSGTPEGHIV